MEKSSGTLLLDENEPGFLELAQFFWFKKFVLLCGLLSGLTIGISHSYVKWQPTYTTDIVLNLDMKPVDSAATKGFISQLCAFTVDKSDFFLKSLLEKLSVVKKTSYRHHLENFQDLKNAKKLALSISEIAPNTILVSLTLPFDDAQSAVEIFTLQTLNDYAKKIHRKGYEEQQDEILSQSLSLTSLYEKQKTDFTDSSTSSFVKFNEKTTDIFELYYRLLLRIPKKDSKNSTVPSPVDLNTAMARIPQMIGELKALGTLSTREGALIQEKLSSLYFEYLAIEQEGTQQKDSLKLTLQEYLNFKTKERSFKENQKLQNVFNLRIDKKHELYKNQTQNLDRSSWRSPVIGAVCGLALSIFIVILLYQFFGATHLSRRRD